MRKTLAATCAAFVVGIAPVGLTAQELTLRATGAFPQGHTATIGMEKFASEVENLTNGEVKVELFPGSQLGGAFEQVDQIRSGQISIAWVGPGFWARVVPEFDAATLPFAAADAEQAFCIIDSELGEHLEEKASEKGIVVLGWMDNGARHVTNSVRPIKTLEDLEGIKIRVVPGETYLATFRALGANPTPIDIKELYQALQQGVVDAQENPYDNILVRKFYEVQDFVSNTGHFFSWAVVLMHKPTFDGLSSQYQDAIRQAMDTAVTDQRQLAERQNASALEKLIEQGMQYDEIPTDELAKFREATRPVYDTIRERVGDEVMDIAANAIEQCRS